MLYCTAFYMLFDCRTVLINFLFLIVNLSENVFIWIREIVDFRQLDYAACFSCDKAIFFSSIVSKQSSTCIYILSMSMLMYVIKSNHNMVHKSFKTKTVLWFSCSLNFKLQMKLMAWWSGPFLDYIN